MSTCDLVRIPTSKGDRWINPAHVLSMRPDVNQAVVTYKLTQMVPTQQGLLCAPVSEVLEGIKCETVAALLAGRMGYDSAVTASAAALRPAETKSKGGVLLG